MAGSLYCKAMKYVPIALLILAGAVFAQDAPDPVKVLTDLAAANKAKDVTAISMLLDPIAQIGKTAKDAKTVDPLAKGLTVSFKLAKGNYGTLRKILDTLGTLRSKKSASFLKKIAFKDAGDDPEKVSLQVHALAAIGMLGDKKYVDAIVDTSKSRSIKVAEAAYGALGNYGVAKGKVRKGVAEQLMKRLESEYPSASADKNPGEEARKRWEKIQQPIVKAMQAVCHEPTINDVPNWREWWKENKKNAKAWKDKKPEPAES